MKPQRQSNLYDDLLDLPDSVTGEILAGQLYAHPQPGGKHVLVASNLVVEIGGPYHRGRGGPGSWWILQEPEVHLSMNDEVVVPDVAGWQKERLPEIPDSNKFTVLPDWVCEILSPSTSSIDREIKKPLYAQYGVRYLWLVSPEDKELEAFKLIDGDWKTQGMFDASDHVAVEPFDSAAFRLRDLFD